MDLIDPNPYSTQSNRDWWQQGFEGKPCGFFDCVGSFNWCAWDRGRQYAADGVNRNDPATNPAE
jgi:hypothetical protein